MLLTAPQYADAQRGWPLRKPVTDRELLAVASRVPGVMLVNDVKIAEGTKAAATQIAMTGLELPRVTGIWVSSASPWISTNCVVRAGVAAPAAQAAVPARHRRRNGKTQRLVPVPVIPEES